MIALICWLILGSRRLEKLGQLKLGQPNGVINLTKRYLRVAPFDAVIIRKRNDRALLFKWWDFEGQVLNHLAPIIENIRAGGFALELLLRGPLVDLPGKRRRFAADDRAMVAPRTGMPGTSMTCRSAAISQERSAFRSARITTLNHDPRHRAVVLSDRAQR